MKRNFFKKAILCLNSTENGQKGMTLIEVLVALSIMGFVAGAFVVGVGMNIQTGPINQDYINAEMLAKSQMEYTKGQTYVTTYPPTYSLCPDISVPQGLFMPAPTVNFMGPNQQVITTDNKTQRIIVRVYKGVDASGSLLVELIGYKVK